MKKIGNVILFLLAVLIPLIIMVLPVLPIIPANQRISAIWMFLTVPTGLLFYYSLWNQIKKLWLIIKG